MSDDEIVADIIACMKMDWSNPDTHKLSCLLHGALPSVAKREIEACAKIAEELVPDFEPIPCPDGDPTCLVAHARNIKRHRSWPEIAATIRARAKTERE